jgi:hypothetical protein
MYMQMTAETCRNSGDPDVCLRGCRAVSAAQRARKPASVIPSGVLSTSRPSCGAPTHGLHGQSSRRFSLDRRGDGVENVRAHSLCLGKLIAPTRLTRQALWTTSHPAPQRTERRHGHGRLAGMRPSESPSQHPSAPPPAQSVHTACERRVIDCCSGHNAPAFAPRAGPVPNPVRHQDADPLLT